MAPIRFYDLELGSIPKQFWSPNTCKTRFALNFKGIPYDTEWLSFQEVPKVVPTITKSKAFPTVPIIVDIAHDNHVVQDSWEIAQYLEKAYPDTPSLFHGQIGVHLFFHEYCTRKLLPKIFKLCVLTIRDRITPESAQQWFTKTREKAFRMPLEKFAGDPKDHMKGITELLIPIGRVLKQHPYITGHQAGWADIVLAAYLQLFVMHRPELFDALVINDPKYGSAFSAWWKRVEIYRGNQPPSAAARL
ncbi:hypothetical protein BX666DRAFT_2003453 [Dichotomocladium elegans]|nr:hypothetical protein BX666DRAFT_2003453 [Dichotomocladium elegans]